MRKVILAAIIAALLLYGAPANALPRFKDPFVEGYQACQSTYVAERVRPLPSGKAHIDVCVMKCRTVHVRTKNGAVHRVNEALYPDEVNRIMKRIETRKYITVVRQRGFGLRKIRTSNIVDVNVFETPLCRLELATAPYFLGPAFQTPFRIRIGES
jgi:hypothetical protein